MPGEVLRASLTDLGSTLRLIISHKVDRGLGEGDLVRPITDVIHEFEPLILWDRWCLVVEDFGVTGCRKLTTDILFVLYLWVSLGETVLCTVGGDELNDGVL